MPLLSICIPTYNRAEHLDETLENITSKDFFSNTDLIEIVISDNCSEDKTPEIVEKYAKRFPEKIRYYRNEENILDKNFAKVLSYAKGELLKLHNDTFNISDDFFPEIIELINKNIEKKPVIFILNGCTKSKEPVTFCKNFDEFVLSVSHMSTWIGGFCIWREDFEKIDDFSNYAKFQLSQTEVLFKILAEKNESYVLNKLYFKGHANIKKGVYNIAEVFGTNYVNLLKKHLENGDISKKVYQKEKKRILYELIIPNYFDFKNRYNFKKSGYLKFLKEYRKDFFFYASFLKVAGDFIGISVKKIIRGH